jgi:hypothetical protein
LADSCKTINATVQALAEIHRYTPSPRIRLTYNPQPFTEEPPSAPEIKKVGWFAKLFRRMRERIEQENRKRRNDYDVAHAAWQRRKAWSQEQEQARKKFIEQDVFSNVGAMESWLEENLSEIEWARETIVSFDISADGKQISIDVDLPEIEQMPTKTASLPAKGYKISMKHLSGTQLQRQYMWHVHGIGFRIIGEAFSDLPTVAEVVLSAYSQRPNPATAEVQDEYPFNPLVGSSNLPPPTTESNGCPVHGLSQLKESHSGGRCVTVKVRGEEPEQRVRDTGSSRCIQRRPARWRSRDSRAAE